MTKVVHLTSVHAPFDGRIFFKECQTLREAGFEVVLIAPHHKNEIINGIKIKGVRKHEDRLTRLLKTTFDVYTEAKKENGDIYHFHDPELMIIGFLLTLNGSKVIFDMHENVPKSIRSKEWIPKSLRKIVELIYKGFERLFVRNFGVILAEKSYEEEYSWLTKKETILNLPKVGDILNIRSKKREKPSIGYIGGINELRGSTVMLKVLSKLKKKGLDIQLELVGEGSDSHIDELSKIAAQRNLDVNFHGFKPVNEGLKIISRCHIGFALLENIPNYTGSYPTKIFEYMALGIPVIASNFPLYISVIEKEFKCGICVSPRDIDEISNAVIELFKNVNKAREMGRNGRKHVQKEYKWSNEGEKLISFYENLISGNKSN